MSILRVLEAGPEESSRRQALWNDLDLSQRRGCLATDTLRDEALGTLMDLLRTCSTKDAVGSSDAQRERLEEGKDAGGFFSLALFPLTADEELIGWQLGLRRNVLLSADAPLQLSSKGRGRLSKAVLMAAKSMQGVAVRVKNELARDAGSRKGRAQIVAALYLALELRWIEAADTLLAQQHKPPTPKRSRPTAKRTRATPTQPPLHALRDVMSLPRGTAASPPSSADAVRYRKPGAAEGRRPASGGRRRRRERRGGEERGVPAGNRGK